MNMKYIRTTRKLINNLILLICISGFGQAELINVEFKTIQLSYIQTDRAAGILKALGYAVIDFSAEVGPNSTDKIFAPNSFGDILINGQISPDNLDYLPLVIILPETGNITFQIQALSTFPKEIITFSEECFRIYFSRNGK